MIRALRTGNCYYSVVIAGITEELTEEEHASPLKQREGR